MYLGTVQPEEVETLLHDRDKVMQQRYLPPWVSAHSFRLCSVFLML